MAPSSSIGSINDQPAAHLVGRDLEGGWRPVRRIDPGENKTGGNFSVGYLAERIDDSGNATGEVAFVKAIDYSKWQLHGPDFVTSLNAMTDAFVFEREIIEKCSTHKMRNVIRGFGHGVVTVGDGPIAPVNFIVFEVAQGDVREHLDGLAAFDEAWALRVLHNIASGLNQLHGADIFHQDLKPSNVLMFPQATKLGDLGRAQGGALPSPHSDIHGPGDLYYSPPECWYGFTQGDALARSRAIDIYHLGSMIMFMFTRVSVTAALASHMDEQLYPQNWAGTFDQVLPHLRDGFDQVALDLESQLPDWLKTGLVELVRQLCDPDPRLRGRSKMSVGSAVRMSVEYYVSRLDFLSRKAEVELRKALS